MSESSPRLRRGWSELQAELLEPILEKLDLADHARFASVCPSWRSVAIQNPPTNKPLYFALSHKPENLVRRFITSFVPSWIEARFFGALDGWLVTHIDGQDLFLLNKGFNSMIRLPFPPKDLQISIQRRDFCKAVLSSPPLPESSAKCTVVIGCLHIPFKGLFYCRLGSDNSFTNLLDDGYIVQDVQFYEGQLYVLYNSSIIVIFDHDFNKVTQLDAHLGDIPAPVRNRTFNHLLVSENKLLMIAKWLDPIRVFELECSNSRVVRVKAISENLLLLINDLCSVSITADKHKEFRRKNYGGFGSKHGTCVLYMGKDPHEATAGDPCPLFFSMFKQLGIENERSKA